MSRFPFCVASSLGAFGSGLHESEEGTGLVIAKEMQVLAGLN